MDRGITLKQVVTITRNTKTSINTMFLAIVESYDRVTGKITVLPKLKMLDNDGKYIDRALLFECPTSCIKARDFYLRIPYQKGDIVYVGCSQEALDDLLIDGNTTVSNLEGVERFRLTDAIILGGVFVDSEPVMTNEFPEDFVIQNRQNKDIIVLKKDGGIFCKTSTKFQIDANEVEINSPLMTMNVDSTVTNGNSIEQNVSNTTNAGNVSIDGNLTVKGNGTVSGALKGGTVDSIKGGKSLDNHTHSYRPGDGSPTSTSPAQ